MSSSNSSPEQAFFPFGVDNIKDDDNDDTDDKEHQHRMDKRAERENDRIIG